MSSGAIGAGLTPIAVGYLVAHYLTYLLISGQQHRHRRLRPAPEGSDLFGTAFFTPVAIPAGRPRLDDPAGGGGGGHMLGAWAGHVTAQRDVAAIAEAKPPRDMRHRKIAAHLEPARCPTSGGARSRSPSMMVALTTLTLWSLGQAIVQEPAATRPPAPIAMLPAAR